jgi:hypothetical protein
MTIENGWKRRSDRFPVARNFVCIRNDKKDCRKPGCEIIERRTSMKCALFTGCVVSVLLLLMVGGTESKAEDKDIKTKIQGIWTIESMDVGSGENKRSTVPQAFMLFIGEKYYSSIRDFSEKPRQGRSGGSGSGSALGSFNADAGTYEYDGETFVVHHKVSMMGPGASMTFGCKMEGDDILILTPQYEKLVMPGMQAPPSPSGKMSYGDRAVLYRFKRLE